jgi:hypothetical protein
LKPDTKWSNVNEKMQLEDTEKKGAEGVEHFDEEVPP